jgi:predicted PurR-regulated permease PerM
MIQRHLIDISAGTLFKVLVFLLAAYILVEVRDIVAAILVAIVVASAIEPAIKWLKKLKIPRSLAVLMIYVVIFLAFLLTIYSIAPQLGSELQQFASDAPVLIEDLEQRLSARYTLLPFDVIFDRVTEYIETNEFSIERLTQSLFEGAGVVFSRVFSLGVIVVVSFYLAVQEQGVGKFLRLVTPEEYETRVVDLWNRSQKKIERWLQGQLLLGLIVGSIVYVGLTLLDIQFALTLAVISALFELIPFFGPIMAAIPGIVIATLQSPMLGVWVFILYIFVQQLENHLIYPVVVRKMVGIAPMIVVVSLLIGAEIAGIFGMVLAIPAVVILTEIIDDMAAHKHHKTSS